MTVGGAHAAASASIDLRH